MSTFHTLSGILKSNATVLGSTSVTTILPASDEYQTVEFIHLSNISTNTPTVLVDIYSGGSTYLRLRGALAMVASTPARLDGAFVLEPGWSLRAQASAGNEVHVLVTYSIPAN